MPSPRFTINPSHLEAVTLTENIRRGYSPTAVNRRKRTCEKGHQYDYLRPNGYRDCRQCKRARLQRYYSDNKATLKERSRQNYWKNRDLILQQHRIRYRATLKEK
jgi:hypothetical protein